MVQTWWLGSFQTGIPGTELCVRVCVCFPSTTTHTHTLLLPPYCSTSPWHTPAFRSPHCRTRTSGAEYQSENSGTRLGGAPLPLQSAGRPAETHSVWMCCYDVDNNKELIMPRYAIIAVIQLLCSQNESIQNDKYEKFPMHLKIMRHSLQGTGMMGPKPLQEKKKGFWFVFLRWLTIAAGNWPWMRWWSWRRWKLYVNKKLPHIFAGAYSYNLPFHTIHWRSWMSWLLIHD